MLCLLKVTFWFFRYSYQYHIIRKKEYLVEIITSHHSMSLVCRSLSLVLSRYSTDCHPLSVVVTCCHSLSIVVTLFTIVVTCFCSLSLDVSLVCLVVMKGVPSPKNCKLETWHFIKKETLTQVLSCEFCEFFKISIL